jgi:hypothetical protein
MKTNLDQVSIENLEEAGFDKKQASCKFRRYKFRLQSGNNDR